MIAIDPGKRIGWAIVEGVTITSCGTVSDLADIPNGEAYALIEMPRVYPSPGKWRGDPQHIVRLAFLAGTIAARYPRYDLIEPRQWRGTMPEEPLRRLIERNLLPGEPRGDSPHSWDAIGMCLFSLSRLR